MTKYDFDTIQARRGTDSIKWDYVSQDGLLLPRAGGEDVLVADSLIPMWVADMDFRPAEPIVQALTQRLQGVLGYTRAGPAQFAAIRDWVGQRHGWQVAPAWILATVGTLPMVNLAVQLFTEPGDGVIVQPPLFNPLARAVENNGRLALRNRLVYENGRYSINFADLEAKAADPRCKMLILCNPHNPVGRVWTPAELQQVGDICQKHDLLIVSDELHSDLTYPWATFNSIGAIDPALHERIIVCNGPSKAFNIPGLKAAYAIVPNPALRAQLVQGLQNLDLLFSVDVFSTLALQTAYREGADWLGQLMTYLADNLAYVQAFISTHLPQIRVVQPEAMYLVWLDCRQLGLTAEALRQLFVDEARVYVEMGSTYGDEGAGFVRLNIGCSRQLLMIVLERVKTAVGRLG
ncbi:MAG: MalY/PatB family protein [Chloroflexota bacterium]